MLTSSFIFLQGVGAATERRWWQQGIQNWHHFLEQPSIQGLSASRKSWYDEELRAAQSYVTRGEFLLFAPRLQRREHWRLYETCRSRTGYLDIETTGAPLPYGEVTVVGLHRGGTTTTLVRGDTLTRDRLQTELDACDLLVTFFGSVFDVPYLIGAFPGLRVPPLHFDLCFAARRLGLDGGLKHIEQHLGIERDAALRGLDGWDAVRLWSAACEGDTTALETLLAYNRADTEHLVPLANYLYKDMTTQFGPPPTRSAHRPTFTS